MIVYYLALQLVFLFQFIVAKNETLGESYNHGHTRLLQSSSYVGCFKDTQDRALPVRIPGKNSLTECLSTCSSQGYKYAGRQYLGECYCGNSNYDKHGESDKCEACDSNNVGPYLSCVYGLSSTPAAPSLTPVLQPAPAPQSISATTYQYLGCFNDSKDRALTERIAGSKSLDACLSTCSSQGYKYAGRQYLGECYCGNSDYDKHGESDKCSACDSKNVGPYVSCVYSLISMGSAPITTIAPTTVAPVTTTVSPTLTPLLSPSTSPSSPPTSKQTVKPTSSPITSAPVSPSVSPTTILSSLPSSSPTASPSLSPMTPVTPTISPSVSPSSTPILQPTPGSQVDIIATPQYLGCFRDTKDRALPDKISGSKSLDECISECASQGYKYAGRQYVGECYCGNSDFDKHGSSPDCNACDSTSVGPYLSCVYELFTAPRPSAAPSSSKAPSSSTSPSRNPVVAPSAQPVPGGPQYLGCFKDNASDRALSVKLPGSLSLDECNSECLARGYIYAGRQYTGQCYCGNAGYQKWGSSEGCNACDSANVGPYLSCVYRLYIVPTPPPTPGPTPAPVHLPDGHCPAQKGHGGSAYFDYVSQNEWGNVNGQTNEMVRWSKFPAHIFNYKLHNQCNKAQQSPINVCDGSSGSKNTNYPCHETHEIFNYEGSWKLTQEDRIQAKIYGSKLRLEYATRSWGPYEKCCGNGNNGYRGWCPLIKKHPKNMCGPDLPPLADFPHHWNGFTQINHIDFKFPSEHTICGKRYDAEITYWFAWVNRNAAINMAIMVEIGDHNSELEKVILKFEETNQKARSRCTGGRRNLRETKNDSTMDIEYDSKMVDASDIDGFDFFNDEPEYTNMTSSPFFPLSSGQVQTPPDQFNPFSNHIIRTKWFYGYWGSLTEPPCIGSSGNPHKFIAWRIMDTPTTMSQNQLNRLKQALLSNVDENCKCTSVARLDSNNQWNVARDLQPRHMNTGIHKCYKGVHWP